MKEREERLNSETIDEQTERDAAGLSPEESRLVQDVYVLSQAYARENEHSLERIWSRFVSSQEQPVRLQENQRKEPGDGQLAMEGKTMQEKDIYQQTGFSPIHSRSARPARRSFWRALSIGGVAAVVLLTILAWGIFSYVAHNARNSAVGKGGPTTQAGSVDIRSGKLICSFADNNPAQQFPLQPSLDWSSQGQIAATYNNLKTVTAQNCATVSSSANQYSNAAWSPNGKYLLVSSSFTGQTQVLDASSGNVISTFPPAQSSVNSGAIAQQSTGRSFMGSLSGGPNNTPAGYTVYMSLWSADGTQVISAVTRPDAANPHNILTSVVVWNASTGAIVRTLATLEPNFVPLGLSPNRQYIAAQQSNGTTIGIWNINSGKKVSAINFGYTSNSALAWSPNGASLALGLPNAARVQIWSVATGQITAAFNDANPTAHVIGALAWSPNGKYLAESTNVIHIWDAAARKFVATFGKVEPGQWTATLAWSPDSRKLVSSTNVVGKDYAQNTVNVWKLA